MPEILSFTAVLAEVFIQEILRQTFTQFQKWQTNFPALNHPNNTHRLNHDNIFKLLLHTQEYMKNLRKECLLSSRTSNHFQRHH